MRHLQGAAAVSPATAEDGKDPRLADLLGTALTNLFTGRPARGIVNRLMRELGAISGQVPAFPLTTAAISALRAKAEAMGSADFSPLWAGQNTRRCREAAAAEITADLARGFQD